MSKFKVTIRYKNNLDNLDGKIERTLGKVASKATFDGVSSERVLEFKFHSKSVTDTIEKRLEYLPKNAEVSVQVSPTK